jgi:chemotaxis protein CheZ
MAFSPGSGATVTDLDTRLAAMVGDQFRAEITPLFQELHRFVDRRIAELSAEVHGTAQLLDFSEVNLSGQLSRIHEQIASVVARPTQASYNSGLELEAVVHATENAANQIMEAAEVIGDWVHGDRTDPAGLEMVAEKVNAIFEACTFQDITGQRIRRAIEHLQRVENMLTDIIPEGTAAPGRNVAPDPAICPDLIQDEVDRLFNSTSAAAPVATDMEQSVVDRMFD